MPNRSPYWWEWAFTIVGNAVAIGGILAGWYLGNDPYLLVGLFAAAMVLGFNFRRR